jgi:hypothetical protein
VPASYRSYCRPIKRLRIDAAVAVLYGAPIATGEPEKMQYLETPPRRPLFDVRPERARQHDRGAAGRLFVGHASLGHVFVFAATGELIARIKSCAVGSCTNVAIGGARRDRLYITESVTGSVLVADISVLDS